MWKKYSLSIIFSYHSKYSSKIWLLIIEKLSLVKSIKFKSKLKKLEAAEIEKDLI